MLQLLIQGERKTDRMAFCKGKKRTHLILGVYENIWRWYARMREKKAPEMYLQKTNRTNESSNIGSSRENFGDNNT